MSAGAPPASGSVERVPLVGPKILQEWEYLSASRREDPAARAAPFVSEGIRWLAGRAGGVGRVPLHVLITVADTVNPSTADEIAAWGVKCFARRLADERGEESVVLAGRTIRAVALGVVVTAIVQSLAAGIGLAVS